MGKRSANSSISNVKKKISKAVKRYPSCIWGKISRWLIAMKTETAYYYRSKYTESLKSQADSPNNRGIGQASLKSNHSNNLCLPIQSSFFLVMLFKWHLAYNETTACPTLPGILVFGSFNPPTTLKNTLFCKPNVTYGPVDQDNELKATQNRFGWYFHCV